MTTAEEVRGLAATSAQRWTTLALSGRAWQDRLVRGRVTGRVGRDVRLPRVERAHHDAIAAGAAAFGQREQEWRLWRRGEARVRSEYTIGRETITVVGQGGQWWRWSPTLGSTSGRGATRPVRLVLGPAGVLLDPARLLAPLEIDAVTPTTGVAGRSALTVKAHTGTLRPRERLALREAGAGADTFELVIDAELGILLAVRAFVGEEPLQVVEVAELTVDHELPEPLFVPEKLAADRYVSVDRGQRASLEEIAKTVGFAVFAFEPAVSPLPPHVAYFERDRRGLGPHHVIATYVVVDEERGRGQLRVTFADGDLPKALRDEWGIAGELEVAESQQGRALRSRVRGQRDGTYFELESSILPAGHLAALVATFVPLPRA